MKHLSKHTSNIEAYDGVILNGVRYYVSPNQGLAYSDEVLVINSETNKGQYILEASLLWHEGEGVWYCD